MDALFTVIVEIGKSLISPIKRNCSYVLHFRRNIRALNNEKEDLMVMQTNVQCLIDEAQRRQEEIFKEVNGWITEVSQIASAVDGLNEEANETRMCVMGQCPNLGWRYRAGKRGVRKLEVVQRLKQRGDLFDRVSSSPSAPAVEPIRTLDNVEELERGKSLLEQIREALCDDRVRSVGVHGMGGIGKTTLMKCLNNALQGTGLFDRVIMVTVSANPDSKRIQQQIADRLDLKFCDQQSFSRRANQLAKAIADQQRVLIILDDVWKKLEMYELGIPVTEQSGCCKIIITSRIKTVCQQMNMEVILTMGVLSETDSWNLFKSTTGDVALNPDLLSSAKEIVGECKGSPLAIVTIGSVLRGEGNASVWHGTLMKLQSAETSDQEGVMGEVIETIRISYDHLRYEDMRKCFLFCCLFGEDEDIPIESLLMYGIGEGFLKSNKGNLSDNWKLLEFYVENLKNHNLLLHDESEESLLEEDYREEDQVVRLHDVVRETGKLIAQHSGYGFVSKAGLGLSKCPTLNKPQECKHVSLMDNEITLLPEWPECPQLRTLLLQGNFYLENIPEAFFGAMPELFVLDMSLTRLKMLPPSMACLRNLRTLVLDYCREIKDISVVGSMKQLQMLSLKETQIRELPKELGELTNLKFLDLRNNYCLKRIAPVVFSRMLNLQVLYLWHTMVKWDAQGKRGFRNASFSEVASLHCLTDLYLSIRNASCFSMAKQFWHSLQRFDILVEGEHNQLAIPYYKKAQIYAPYNRTLQLFSLSCPFPCWVDHLMQKTELLFLDKCTRLKNLPPFVSSNGYLVHLNIEFCNEMECLMNTDQEMCPSGFTSLREMSLRRMAKLETICKGPLPHVLFRHLQKLVVRSCEKLKFELDHILALRSLEVLTLDGCHEMEYLIDTTKTQNLSSDILACLKELTLTNMKKMKKLCHGPLPSRFLTNLQDLNLHHCKNMINDLFYCGQLQSLDTLDCIFLEGIDEMEVALNLESTSISPNAFQNLKKLYIVGMKKIKEVVHGLFPFAATTAFHNLEVLYISECHVLRSLFTMTVALSSLKKLNTLMIQGCEEMEVLLLEEQEEREKLPLMDGVLLPKLTSMWLENLPELKILCNMKVFPCFPILETITVLKCPKLKRLPLKKENLDCLKEIQGGRKWFEDLDMEEELKSHLQSLFKVHWSENVGFEFAKGRFSQTEE
ncbi:hypothetical protein H6P81_005493 [Aristolochia fimbriata]|uniref:AAA+ ATPase domain-containing protein n=1 Tax=Aristolochia fimbriata TaxID=158543 RepID=A0AAV7EW20_ARIFI|nr:hypothetical protein H6P81_005493 [Aristolochia fimbriata]